MRGSSGQLGEPAAEVGDRAVLVERAEFLQQLHTVADAALVRRVEERKVLDVAEIQRRHLQDHRGEVGPQDLGIGVAGPGFEVGLGVEPDAHAGRGTRPSGPPAARPRPARWARSAAAAPWSCGCSARCARCRGRRRSGCPARSARSRRRWWRARLDVRYAARTPAAARPSAAARRAAAPRCFDSRPRKASAVSRISRSPDRNTSTSPGGSASSSRDGVDDRLGRVAKLGPDHLVVGVVRVVIIC